MEFLLHYINRVQPENDEPDEWLFGNETVDAAIAAVERDVSERHLRTGRTTFASPAPGQAGSPSVAVDMSGHIQEKELYDAVLVLGRAG